MINDIRVYNYDENGLLIGRTSQIEEYLDKKFSSIEVDVDLSKVERKLCNIDCNITHSTEHILDAIEESKPCLCHLATKEDLKQAKCNIIQEIKESEQTIIKEIDEKFVNLNDLINNQ